MHTPRLALPTPWPRQAEPTGTCSHAAFSGRHEQRGGSSCPGHSLMRYPSTGLPLTLKLSFSAANGGTRVTISGKVGGDAEKVANQHFWAQTLSAH